MNLKKLLNEKQYEAATYLDSHLRIIAGAGSGKTRVITYRIAYLIENIGVHPKNILAITFTNKAANEMKERVEKILGTQALGSTISTIHSMCVRVLRQHISKLGYGHNFIIMDEEDQKALVKKLLKELSLDSKIYTPKSLIHYISSYKTAFITPKKALSMNSLKGEKDKAKLYQAYEDYNRAHNMLDFDDLLLKTLELFRDNPDIVERWSQRYQYVHVDEFQDVGEIEYELISFFGKDSIVCVVGDPDQTIYSFRGSDVNFIIKFDQDYEDVKTIYLNQNYRSTRNILEVSNNLIRKNKNRLDKELFSNLEEGTKTIHFSGRSEEAEAQYVADQIEILRTKYDLSYKDFAVLYRANYLSRSVEQILIKMKIPYRIFGGLKFFSRKEIKDALSYIRLLVSNDDLSFERIINVPTRNIGIKTLEKIQAIAINHRISDYEAICYYMKEMNLSVKVQSQLKNLIQIMENARLSKDNPEDIFDHMFKDLGYYEMLEKNEEKSRIENLMELKSSIAGYMRDHPDTADFESYLQEIALYTSQDTVGEGDYVSLMSIHMAKGLEFEYVFVTGLSENIFPSLHALEEEGNDGLEEERRLAYVAFTRAKKALYLTDSQGFSYISHSPKLTSRFISELGKNKVEHIGAKNKFKTENYINTKETVEEMIGDNEITDWKAGDLLIHDVFGKGVVVNVNGEMLDVAFNIPYGLKTLMGSHKAIKRLSN